MFNVSQEEMLKTSITLCKQETELLPVLPLKELYNHGR